LDIDEEGFREFLKRGSRSQSAIERCISYVVDFAGPKDNIIELHEIWLRKKYRGKGYGKRFFEFFEELIGRKGYDSVVYYADHPAALAICRRRGYTEDYLESEGEYVFYIQLKNNTS
jgi:GNAT superfamily N-acetyltransferase